MPAPSKMALFDANLGVTRCVCHKASEGPVFRTELPKGPKYKEMVGGQRWDEHFLLLLELHHGAFGEYFTAV
jgi:hypothetical protein